MGHDDVDDRGSGTTRALRRDARANQERLLAAAVTVMLREGRQVPMAAIAAEAGVGVGTLYRHYPSRAVLLDRLTARAFTLLAEIVERALVEDGSALDRLGWWWDRVIEVRDQLVLPLHGGPPVREPRTLAARAELHDGLGRLLLAGRADRTIRDDVSVADIVIFGAMLVSPPPGVEAWDALAVRQKQIHLDGLAARPHPAPPG